MSKKTRYSAEELEEFRAIIVEKLEVAKQEYENYRAAVTNADGNDTVDTSPTYKVLEEGASTLSKEEAGRLAQRQMKFIQNLQAALVRLKTVHMVYAAKQVNLSRKNAFALFLMLHSVLKQNQRKGGKINHMKILIYG
jgi:DnaK suppressor protein